MLYINYSLQFERNLTFHYSSTSFDEKFFIVYPVRADRKSRTCWFEKLAGIIGQTVYPGSSFMAVFSRESALDDGTRRVGMVTKCTPRRQSNIPLKGVDTDNAARCIPTQSCPKHGFGKLRCLSLYEQILGWARPHSKEEGSVQRALVMV